MNEPREGPLSRVWDKISATATQRTVVVVIHSTRTCPGSLVVPGAVKIPQYRFNALSKYAKEPWLYPTPPLTNERSSVGRAQALHMLVYPFSIHSSNGLGCIVQLYHHGVP